MTTTPRRIAAFLGLSLMATPSCNLPVTPDPLAVTSVIELDGRTRTFRVYIPESNVAGPMPIVFVLHGLGGNGLDMEIGSGFDDVAARKGFMVVYPEADASTQGEWALDCERCTNADVAGIRDIAYIDTLLARFVRGGRADPARAYVTGFSLGSYFTNVIACKRASGFAAAVAVAGQMTDRMAAECPASEPIAMLVVGSKDDPKMPWDGGVFPKFTIYSADSTARFWAARNQCAFPATAGAPLVTAGGQRRASTLFYGSCAKDAEVRLWAFDGIGHSWPRGAPDVTELMADFLLAHRRSVSP